MTLVEQARDVRLLLAALAGAIVALAATGIAMALPYDTDPTRAHSSVAAMAPLLRSVHGWSASLAVALSLVLSVRVFLSGDLPRGTRFAVVGVVGLLLAAFETGAVLSWDHRAWEAWLHVQSGARLFGITFGAADDPSTAPLALVLGAHVGIALAIIALFAWFARPSARVPEVLRVAVPALVLVAFVAVGLALVAPVTLGPAPVMGLAVSRPHWPFLWLTPLQVWWGTTGLLALPALFALCAMIAWHAPTSRPTRIAITLGIGSALAVLTWIGGRAG